MSADLTGFDATQHESNNYEPVPAGDYLAMIKSSEWVATKAGNGKFLKLSLSIVEGEHKGKTVVDRLNLQNPNPKAVQIANGSLADICRSVNVLRPHNSSELHNKPMLVRVGLEERNDRPGEYQNRVKGYKPPDAAPAPAAAAKAADDVPPWKRAPAPAAEPSTEEPPF